VDVDLRVPTLCDIEVAAGLRRALIRDLVSADRAELAVQHYLSLPLTRHGHQALLPSVLELRANFVPTTPATWRSPSAWVSSS
jgi:predicted nucleic acid-binding protein